MKICFLNLFNHSVRVITIFWWTVCLFCCSNLSAATEQKFWMVSIHDLNRYQLKLLKDKLVPIQGAMSSHYRFIKRSPENLGNQEHVRYTMTYDNIPVWGKEIIIHHKHNHAPKISGTLVSKIEQDLPKNISTLPEVDAIAPILTRMTTPIKAQQVQQVIFLDNKKIAHQAYLLSFFTTDNDFMMHYPHYIIDATNGLVLDSWDEANASIDEGEGLGGNTIALPYRKGAFQYGTSKPYLPSLGRFPVERWSLWCYLQTPEMSLIDLERFYIPSPAMIFPINISDESNNNLYSPYSLCMPWNYYNSDGDNDHTSTNGAFSANNDSMYFVHETFELYRQHGMVNPLGSDLPLKIFTHVSMANAFYIPSVYNSQDGSLFSHQQIAIGDGNSGNYSVFSQSVIAHEVSHGFTANQSKLIHKEQSGAINESFSDITSIALRDLLRKKFPFYWDGEDWTIGSEIAFNGVPLRYLDSPQKDNRSIEHFKDYKKGLDVHYSSGIFNRAFYLLSSQPSWDIQTAYDVMMKANANYWTPDVTFNLAACGVIQATLDNEMDTSAVIFAFNEVGVSCKQD